MKTYRPVHEERAGFPPRLPWDVPLWVTLAYYVAALALVFAVRVLSVVIQVVIVLAVAQWMGIL